MCPESRRRSFSCSLIEHYAIEMISFEAFLKDS
jgi:hypothetical protein